MFRRLPICFIRCSSLPGILLQPHAINYMKGSKTATYILAGGEFVEKQAYRRRCYHRPFLGRQKTLCHFPSLNSVDVRHYLFDPPLNDSLSLQRVLSAFIISNQFGRFSLCKTYRGNQSILVDFMVECEIEEDTRKAMRSGPTGMTRGHPRVIIEETCWKRRWLLQLAGLGAPP